MKRTPLRGLRFVAGYHSGVASLRSRCWPARFEPGTSASRTQRSTGLSHAPLIFSYLPRARMKRTPLRGLRFVAGLLLGRRFAPVSEVARSVRTGDLCVPNAALYRTEPRPVFFPCWSCARMKRIPASPGSSAEPPADGVGFEPTRVFSPTRFPIVRLKPLGHPSEKKDPQATLWSR